MVAGFIIALKAGASLKNLDTGGNLNEEDIVAVLENPSAKFRYVMACNEQLANEVVQLLNLKNGAVIEFKDPSH